MCTEFIPYKYPSDSTNLVHTTKYLLCEYNGKYYLLSGDKNPNVETYLILIHNDLAVAVDAFRKECQSYIKIRKSIDFCFDLAPEIRAKLEKVEYNDIPNYNEILKYFNKPNKTAILGNNFN